MVCVEQTLQDPGAVSLVCKHESMSRHTCPKLVETTLKPSRKTLWRDDFGIIPDHKNVKFETICNRPWKKT